MEILARKSWIAGMAVLTACFFALLLMNDLHTPTSRRRPARCTRATRRRPSSSTSTSTTTTPGRERRPRVQRGARLRHESADRPRRVHDGDVRVRHLPGPRTGLINETSDLTVGTIRANSCIDSHMVHADVPGAGSSLTQVLYNGSVQFDSPILGVILTDANLIASDIDPGLAPSPVTYGVTPSRGLEFGANADRITIDTAQNRITFQFDVRTTMDQIRVITLGDADSCPGQAKTLTPTPKAASNQVNTTHCVDASVQTETSAARAGGYRPVRRRGRLRAGPESRRRGRVQDDEPGGVAQHCYRARRRLAATRSTRMPTTTATASRTSGRTPPTRQRRRGCRPRAIQSRLSPRRMRTPSERSTASRRRSGISS